MSAYCAKSDLVERFGASELAQLTDPTAAATINDVEVANACDEASSLIDGYLASRYTLPLVTVPTIVRSWACVIAWKILNKDRAKADSVVILNYNDAIARLKDVAKGIGSLPDALGIAPASSGGVVVVKASTAIFSDSMLGNMPG